MARKPLSDTERLRKTFDYQYDNMMVAHGEIRVYYIRDPQGREWVPFGGGPLYRQQAIDQAAWLARHVDEFRCLLPRHLRQHRIVFGELSSTVYPAKFYPMALPSKTPKKEETPSEQA